MSIETGPWQSLRLIELVDEGNRNEVWSAEFDGIAVAVRQSRRSAASLQWELDLISALAAEGFVVPDIIETDDGRRHVDGVVVQRWIDGAPPTSTSDWTAVADELRRLHRSVDLAVVLGQRPDCCSVSELGQRRCSVDADLDVIPDDVLAVLQPVFDEFSGVPSVIVHGDPDPSNLRITSNGSVGLLDWDESRLDVPFHDLSNLGTQVLADDLHARANRLSHAWEVANAWTAEPGYARRRLGALIEAEGRTGRT